MANNYKIKKDSYFINPYNYVSLKKKVNTNERENSISGIINCSLEVITPLAIPDKANKNGEYPFFRIDGNPVIPASSIRGPIRSMYETVTNSCYSTTKDDDMITTRYKPGGFKPGILVYDKKDDKWELYEATRYLIPIKGYIKFRDVEPVAKVERNENDEEIVCGNNSFRFGDSVSAECTDIEYKKNGDIVWSGVVKAKTITKNNKNEMFIYLGEPFQGKKHGESLFVKQENKVRDVTHNEMAGIYETKRMYADDGVNSKYGASHFGYSGFEKAKENGYIPIWYSKKGELSLAAVGRKAFKNNIASFAGERCKIPKSEQEDIDNRDSNNIAEYLCPACALFGTAPYSSKYEGYGSKLRISDVIIENAKFSEEFVLLKELAKPRNSYLPFHSVKGIDYDRKGGAIRGRKFYWHNTSVNSDASIYSHALNGKKELNDEEKKEVKRANKVELLMPNDECKGRFSVYFDNISVEELKRVMWILTIGGDSSCGYKLGHGKPLGLGSVRISIDSVIEKTVTNGYELTKIYSNSGDTEVENEKVSHWKEVFSEDNTTVKEVKRITSFSGLGTENEKDIEIRYPYVVKSDDYSQNLGKNDLASHHWFKQFKQNNKTLPSVLEDQKLPVYELCENQDNLLANTKHGKGGKTIHTFEKEKQYSGKVGRYNDNKTVVYINLEQGGEASLYFKDVEGAEYGKIDSKFPIDTSLIVCYKGRDDKGYNKWKFVGTK